MGGEGGMKILRYEEMTQQRRHQVCLGVQGTNFDFYIIHVFGIP